MSRALSPELNGLLKQTSRTFYWTLKILPAAVRPQISLAYLLARTTDTIADTEIVPAARRLQALQQLRDRILGQRNNVLDFTELARNALAGKPDGLIILANSVDAAMLSQSIRKLNAKIPLGTSEWAATERLIELGGKDVEGLSVAQFHDRNAKQPAYLAFLEAYIRRFKQEPGFAGLFAFDAANVVFEALENKGANQSLKERLLSQNSFSGTQRKIAFDAHGDTQGKTFIVTIQNGAFVPFSSAH